MGEATDEEAGEPADEVGGEKTRTMASAGVPGQCTCLVGETTGGAESRVESGEAAGGLKVEVAAGLVSFGAISGNPGDVAAAEVAGEEPSNVADEVSDKMTRASAGNVASGEGVLAQRTCFAARGVSTGSRVATFDCRVTVLAGELPISASGLR